jgi:hypothetical protein
MTAVLIMLIRVAPLPLAALLSIATYGMALFLLSGSNVRRQALALIQTAPFGPRDAPADLAEAA